MLLHWEYLLHFAEQEVRGAFSFSRYVARHMHA